MQDDTLFVHYHIPKTAGTSLQVCLDRWFSDTHLKSYHPVPGYAYSKEELDRIIEKNPHIRCISSHSIGRYYPEIGGRKTSYFCFVRNPVALYISDITYTKLNYDKLSQEHKNALPSGIVNMSIHEISSYWMNRFGSRCQSTFFNKFVKCEMDKMKQLLMDCSTAADIPEQASLALAMIKVDSFSFVGLQEYFHDHLVALAQFFTDHGITASVDSTPKRNVSHHIDDDLSWVDKPDIFGLTLGQREHFAIIFYNYCRAKWGLPPE